MGRLECGDDRGGGSGDALAPLRDRSGDTRAGRG
ncbi:MAG: hypothetical protein QOG83_180, partial [Alphaproteobacteria bacterium]|nr:hypothetical protein [Alphaproteobacteria bacterium]